MLEQLSENHHEQVPQVRELGKLKTEFRLLHVVPLVDHVTSIKAHLRDMSPQELREMAHDMRGGKVLRLCNDEVLAALLRVWAS